MIQVTGNFLQKQRNIVNSEIRLAKQAYCKSSFNELVGDSRKTWQTKLLREKLGKKSVTSLKVNRVSITSPNALSNPFNNHFATISPNLVSNIDSSGTE